jgi:hypothetical protein
MRIRHLAYAITSALLGVSSVAAPAFAQRPGTVAQPAFQGFAGDRGQAPPAVVDRNRDQRERDSFDRDTGRNSPWQSAFRDGYDEGLRDGRANRRFDPTTSSQFRRGDQGWNRGWGSRDQFTTRYRMAFRDGYERGYRDARQRRWSNGR